MFYLCRHLSLSIFRNVKTTENQIILPSGPSYFALEMDCLVINNKLLLKANK